jgi:hypothetical protein
MITVEVDIAGSSLFGGRELFISASDDIAGNIGTALARRESLPMGLLKPHGKMENEGLTLTWPQAARQMTIARRRVFRK